MNQFEHVDVVPQRRVMELSAVGEISDAADDNTRELGIHGHEGVVLDHLAVNG